MDRIYYYVLRILFYVFPIFSFLTCTSSSDVQENNTNINPNRPPALAEWTVMIFMNGDNNLEQDAITDFLEIARVGSNDKINIIAQVDLIGKYYNVGWTQTLRFKIAKGMEPTPQNAVMDIGEANMGEQKTLTDFVTWSTQRYPAKKFALIVWDHGQGYRFLPITSRLNPALNNLMSLSQDFSRNNELGTPSSRGNVNVAIGDPFRSASQSPVKSCSHDETDTDELFNREIQDGLTESLNGKKLDVLGFDACLMAMIETCYAMRNVSRNFVASEELEPGTGWQYDDWLGKLQSNAAMNGQELAKGIVNSYSATYGSFSSQTLSAVNISEFDHVSSLISTFANSLKGRLDLELSVIKEARSACAVYAPNHNHETPPKDYFFHIDFIRFCEQVISRTRDARLKSDAENAKRAVQNAMLANYKGSNRSGNFGSNGLAIYFPASNSQYTGDIYELGGYRKDNTLFPVEFVQKQQWADFLHAFFERVP